MSVKDSIIEKKISIEIIWTLQKIEIFVWYFENVWQEIFGQNDSQLDGYLFEIVENLERFRNFWKNLPQMSDRGWQKCRSKCPTGQRPNRFKSDRLEKFGRGRFRNYKFGRCKESEIWTLFCTVRILILLDPQKSRCVTLDKGFFVINQISNSI